MPETWRSAFIRQARADYIWARELRNAGAPTCHWLHFLQMAAEKLAKGYTCSRTGGQPRTTHVGFTRFLQSIAPKDQRLRSEWQTRNRHFTAYKEMVRSLIHVGHAIEQLAPALAGQGPNPEYPWEYESRILAPVDFSFPEITTKAGPQLENLFRFLDTCFRTLN